jgi:PTH1 family peptidyl-tRNA hydrolase
MATVIMGLGNPGGEYAKTRHNAGRMAVELVAKAESFGAFALRKGALALVSEGKIDKEKVLLVLPETAMNLSGKSAVGVIKSLSAGRQARKAYEQLLVVRDDLDLPLGVLKMTFNRGSGGHKGVESIMRALKTEAFAQLKIGISGQGKKNQTKKVSGEEKVIKHVIGKFKPAEEALLKKTLKKAALVAHLFATEGIEKAQQEANTR